MILERDSYSWHPVIGIFATDAPEDADLADDPDDRTSTSACVIFLDANLVSWRSTKQRTVARSLTEAEY